MSNELKYSIENPSETVYWIILSGGIVVSFGQTNPNQVTRSEHPFVIFTSRSDWKWELYSLGIDPVSGKKIMPRTKPVEREEIMELLEEDVELLEEEENINNENTEEF